jgi:hypothetical protein
MITSVQALLIAFIIFAISRVFLRFREEKISTGIFLFWSLVWISAVFIVISPPITSRLASYFGIGRGADFIVYISVALLFYLVFRIYVIIEDMRHEITDLVRHIALQKSPKKPSAPLSSSRRRRSLK